MRLNCTLMSPGIGASRALDLCLRAIRLGIALFLLDAAAGCPSYDFMGPSSSMSLSECRLIQYSSVEITSALCKTGLMNPGDSSKVFHAWMDTLNGYHSLNTSSRILLTPMMSAHSVCCKADAEKLASIICQNLQECERHVPCQSCYLGCTLRFRMLSAPMSLSISSLSHLLKHVYTIHPRSGSLCPILSSFRQATLY